MCPVSVWLRGNPSPRTGKVRVQPWHFDRTFLTVRWYWVLFCTPNTGSTGRYGRGDGKFQCFFSKPLESWQYPLVIMFSIRSLIMTSQEIRLKQVILSFGIWSLWYIPDLWNRYARIYNTCGYLSDGDNYDCPVVPRAAVRSVWNNMLSDETR